MVDLSSGACAGRADASYGVADPFYPEPSRNGRPKGDPYAEAREICARCPIRDLCLADALTDTVQWGFRVMTPEERQTLKQHNQRGPANRHRPSETELEQRIHLYHQGLSDRELGDMLDLTDKAIMHWRKRNNLPSNVTPNTPHTAAMTKQKWDLYNAGASDKTIADQVGIPPSSVRNWRRREGLENNRTRMQVPA